MRATKFEFEQRFWIFGAIFWIGFGLYGIDHKNFAVGLLQIIAPSMDDAHATVVVRLFFCFGAILVFFAAWIRTWATSYLRAEVVHDTIQHSESLVAAGPYRHVRNPLYFANLFMAAGAGVMASRIGWAFMVMAMWLFNYRLILREEEGLRTTQGPSYAAYLKAVPRLWPSLTPRVPSAAEAPRWGQAFAAEMIFWIFGGAGLCFAITLNPRIAGIVLASGFAFYFIVLPILKKRAARDASSR
jgi:protein-S-isoprenylcysteine O-methyltransferase Ste14